MTYRRLIFLRINTCKNRGRGEYLVNITALNRLPHPSFVAQRHHGIHPRRTLRGNPDG